MFARIVDHQTGRDLGTLEDFDGTVVPDQDARRFTDGLHVAMPGDPNRKLTYDDGVVYLTALQYALNGAYTSVLLSQ